MASVTEIRERLVLRKEELTELRKVYMDLLKGRVRSYMIDDRQLTYLDLPKLREEIRATEAEIDEYEAQLANSGARKAFGILPRDW